MVQATGDLPESDSHLAAVDLLRGLAITGVIVYHLVVSYFPPGWWFGKPLAVIGTWATNGWLGVNLFFVASGFVLYLPFARRSRHVRGIQDVAQFYGRRARRLLPLFYLSTLLLIALNPSPWPKQELLLLTFTFNFDANTFLPPVNFVLWSLGLEVWFSLVFPLLVVLIDRAGWRTVGVCVFSAALAMRAIGVPTDESVVGHTIPYINPLKDSLIGRLDDFFVGMGLAALYASGFRCSRPRLVAGAGVVLCTMAAVLVDLAARRMLPWQSMILCNTVFQAGAAAMTIAALAMKPLRLRPLELLGMMSYSLYIWHGVIIKHAFVQPPSLVATVRLLVLLAGVAWLSYRYIEFGHVKSVRQLLPRAIERKALSNAPVRNPDCL